jgi:hypothetical protein
VGLAHLGSRAPFASADAAPGITSSSWSDAQHGNELTTWPKVGLERAEPSQGDGMADGSGLALALA